MSLDIDKIILHSLRQGGDGQPHADTRSQTLPPDEAVQGLMAELHRIYNGKGGKGFGFFADPEAAVAELADGEEAPKQPSPAFRIALEQLLDEQTEFVPFSVTVTQMLVKQLVEHALDEQGVLLFAKYNYVGVDYLLIALLEGKESVTVSEALELRHIQYLDIGKLNLVARIDLTEWKTQPDSRRYITFSKGRIGRKLGDFFMDLLGAREGMDAKVQNKGLLQAVEDYCDSRQLEPTERNDYKKQVFKYCTEQASAGEEIEIKELSAELPG
ncbi:MAG: nucleoid-associated protein, partial [Aeromonas veronii]